MTRLKKLLPTAMLTKIPLVVVNLACALHPGFSLAAPTHTDPTHSEGTAGSCLQCAEKSHGRNNGDLANLEALKSAIEPLALDQNQHPLQGITFKCNSHQLKKIEIELKTYFQELGLNQNLINIRRSNSKKTSTQTLNIVLNTPESDTSTLDLHKRPELEIQDEIVSLPTNQKGVLRKVKTVSKKEIAYALLQHGRNTEFSGNQCSTETLKDQIGIRQNTVAWVQEMNWGWPNGEGAKYSKKYWPDGKLVGDHPLAETLRDAFLNQQDYAMGCFSATKLTMANGILDYYDRIKKDPAAVKRISALLMKDIQKGIGPLKNVEPGKMWFFEDNMIYDQTGKITAFNENLTKEQRQEVGRPGKVLQMQEGVAGKNFVPGDWSYFLNPHQESYQKTGYEGSNSIYLGRDKFDDYYSDQYDDSTKEFKNYTFKEKLDEVHQWENGVFSRSRDADKIKPLSENQLERLTETPLKGGLILNYRVVPMTF